MAGGGGDDVDGAARSAGEEVAAEMAVTLRMADHRLDPGASPDLAADGGRDAALLPGDEDTRLLGVAAAVAAVGMGTLDRRAGDAPGLGDPVGERVAAEGVARQGACAASSGRRWCIIRAGIERFQCHNQDAHFVSIQTSQ